MLSAAKHLRLLLTVLPHPEAGRKPRARILKNQYFFAMAAFAVPRHKAPAKNISQLVSARRQVFAQSDCFG
jgi:hypothetical protein